MSSRYRICMPTKLIAYIENSNPMSGTEAQAQKNKKSKLKKKVPPLGEYFSCLACRRCRASNCTHFELALGHATSLPGQNPSPFKRTTHFSQAFTLSFLAVAVAAAAALKRLGAPRALSLSCRARPVRTAREKKPSSVCFAGQLFPGPLLLLLDQHCAHNAFNHTLADGDRERHAHANPKKENNETIGFPPPQPRTHTRQIPATVAKEPQQQRQPCCKA